MAPAVVPQSSCSLRPQAPAFTCSTKAAGRLALEAEQDEEADEGAALRLTRTGGTLTAIDADSERIQLQGTEPKH